MDSGMISLKFAILRNTSAGLRRAGWIAGAVLVLGTWAAAALAPTDQVRHSVLALILAGWAVGGMLGPVLTSGAGVLRAEYFTLLPLSRAGVARALLVSNLVSIAAGFVLLALLATLWHAVVLDPLTVGIAVLGAALSWVFVITLSRLVYGLLGAAMRSRLGIEIAGVQWGILLASMFAGWMIVSVAVTSIPALVVQGLPVGPITQVLDAIPTSWPLVAIETMAAGGWGQAMLLLLALAVLDAVLVFATLTIRDNVVVKRRGRARSVGLVAGGGLLPASQTGAVILKELRQWRRDPWRALESSTAVWTGVVIGIFALLNADTAPVAAFAGLIVAFMLGLSGCNLYGQDGSAVWQNVVGEDATSVRSDVRGREWALVLVFLPRALLVRDLPAARPGLVGGAVPGRGHPGNPGRCGRCGGAHLGRRRLARGGPAPPGGAERRQREHLTARLGGDAGREYHHAADSRRDSLVGAERFGPDRRAGRRRGGAERLRRRVGAR
jgi:ABC-2 type transport system permease protein